MSEAASVLLASGGLDSTTLFYDLQSSGIPLRILFVDYGQHCAATELSTLKDVLPSEALDCLDVVSLGGVYQGTSSRLINAANLWTDEVDYQDLYLPYRSLMLLSLGAAYAQARNLERLYSGFINSNHAQEIDCSSAFFSSLLPMLADYGGVRLEMPYRDWNKTEVVKRAIELGVPVGRTFSCQAGPEVPCGACPNCVDRLDALAAVDALSLASEGP